ncbi:hypothetical protein BCR35DRAFT_300689 [Leucosporidium creatinivorum]|uniref:GDP/GTP exchange factor Sec2 N-terminal domain-containing protein n=1 Tax=Leucosporidium creatinivorum TaxID=106004 RepID=A0A1Y2FZI1_9BASI|nr:hypothetical protein BCR35DRAFT_300689 [Leucosporidium creatinivorum]
MGSQDGHDGTAPPLERTASHASTQQSDDQFDEAPTGNSPALEQEQLPTEESATAHLTTASAPTNNDDNATLAALAASSSSSLPISPTATPGEYLDIDPNSPSFILVAALRSQITDLTSQVTSLNSKLVRSYTSIGDLEDEVHERREGERRAKAKAVELEQDKQRWEREIERGGWVERDHVSAEMQRLMSKVLEETKSRETAVEAHTALETEIDTLTSQLFDEANKMVVVERLARARAEEKMRSLEEAGSNLQAVFEEVQVNLRETVEKLESRDKELDECHRRMAKAGVPFDSPEPEKGAKDAHTVAFSDGDNVVPLDNKALVQDPFNPPLSPSQHAPPRLLNNVLPYHEFLAFIHHLRQLRISVLSRPFDNPAYPHPYTSTASSLAHRGFGTIPHPSSTTVTQTTLINPPSPAQLLAPHLLLSTHLSQPFLKRCVEEDSDPSLRLDLAPGLGFLSRRTIGTAIVDGTLLIEPFFSGAELPSDKCALCGVGLERWSKGAMVAKATGTAAGVAGVRKVLGGGGWGLPTFSSSSSSSGKSGNTPPPIPSPTKSTFDPFSFSSTSNPLPPPPPNEQIHIFRANDTPTSTRYAICPVYCLKRLRAVCEFWTYVRVIERGLLLEEGFRFVQGRGVDSQGGNASARASVEGLGLSGGGGGGAEKVVLGGVAGKEEGGLFGVGGGARRESLQLAEGKVPDEFVMDGGELEISREEEEEEEREERERSEMEKIKEEKMQGGEKTVKEALVVKEEIEKKEEEGEEKKEGDDVKEKKEDAEIEEKVANADEEKNKEPSTLDSKDDTPSSSPTIPQNGHVKPPVPKRSAARTPGSTTPILGSSSPVIPTPSSPIPREETQASSHAPSEPPKLPPRRSGPAPPPRHPSAANSSAATNGQAGDILASAMGWEDRCWSEVVRLKESVFWARVAAVAQDGEQVASRLAKVQE